MRAKYKRFGIHIETTTSSGSIAPLETALPQIMKKEDLSDRIRNLKKKLQKLFAEKTVLTEVRPIAKKITSKFIELSYKFDQEYVKQLYNELIANLEKLAKKEMSISVTDLFSKDILQRFKTELSWLEEDLISVPKESLLELIEELKRWESEIFI